MQSDIPERFDTPRSPLEIGLQQDIRAHILSTLPYDASHLATLAALPIGELLITFLNWQRRFIVPRPRRVHLSAEMQSSPWMQDAAIRPGFDAIVRKLEAGDDISPHLSRRVKVGYDPRPIHEPLGRRRDLDLMLYDWSVHHLHLSPIVEGDGFVTRTKQLLYVSFRYDDAYFIDIFNHTSWTRDRIFEIIIDNWPSIVRDITNIRPATGPSEEERSQLRNAGISSPFVERNGKSYFIGGDMLTSAGTSVQCSRLANAIVAEIRRMTDYINNHPEYIPAELQRVGLAVPNILDLHFEFTPDGNFGILEKQTRLLIRFFS
jgi:hypothetical protein